MLGTGDAEMKDNGDVVLRLCTVGQLEDGGVGSEQVAGCEPSAAQEVTPCAWYPAGARQTFVE